MSVDLCIAVLTQAPIQRLLHTVLDADGTDPGPWLPLRDPVQRVSVSLRPDHLGDAPSVGVSGLGTSLSFFLDRRTSGGEGRLFDPVEFFEVVVERVIRVEPVTRASLHYGLGWPPAGFAAGVFHGDTEGFLRDLEELAEQGRRLRESSALTPTTRYALASSLRPKELPSFLMSLGPDRLDRLRGLAAGERLAALELAADEGGAALIKTPGGVLLALRALSPWPLAMLWSVYDAWLRLVE